MREEEVNGSQAGYQENIDDINSSYNPYHAGKMCAIFLPQDDGNEPFEVTSNTLYLLQMRGLYRGLDHENPHDRVRILTAVCNPFLFKDVSQELINLSTLDRRSCYNL